MAVPAGYTELGRLGFVDKGNYASSSTYRAGDTVYYNGSTYVALKDNLKGVTPANGANWKYLARGFADELLSLVKAIDTSGVLGSKGAEVSAQSLIDAIADRVMTKLLLKTDVSNQIINDANKAISAAAAYALNQKVGDTAQLPDGAANVVAAITKQNSDIGVLHSDFDFTSVGNAQSDANWTVTASNIVIKKLGFGIVFGTITHKVATVPAWGELVGTFPNFSSKYNIPLLLFSSGGDILVSACVSPYGQIKLYGDDLKKFDTANRKYDFHAAYVI